MDTICQQWAECAKGKFVSSVGTAVANRACTECPEGKYTDNINLGAPVSCGPGQYQNSPGQSGCKLCELGKVSEDTANAVGCDACAAGKVQS